MAYALNRAGNKQNPIPLAAGLLLPAKLTAAQISCKWDQLAEATACRHNGQCADPQGEDGMSGRKPTIHLAALGALAAAMLASTAALAQLSDDIVKIGVLTDMNGPAATPTGQGSVTAAQMAIDDFGGKVLGKPINLIVGDHQLKPDIGGALARRW